MLAHGLRGFLALGRFAVEGLVNGFAERVPQLLLLATLQRHRMGVRLPALLERFDGVEPQHWRGPQGLGLLDHGLALLQILLLHRFQRGRCRVKGGLPLRLHLGKGFFTQVAGLAPALGKLVQDAVKAFPVVVSGGGVVGRPGFQFFDQRQTMGLVFGGIDLDFFQPGLHHLVGFVTGLVKTLPQGVVGYAALIGLLPLLTQTAQHLL